MPDQTPEVAPWEEQAQAVVANLRADLAEVRAARDEAIRLLDFMTTERDNLKELVLVLRGFRPNALCPRCRAPRPCGCEVLLPSARNV
jgi:hypothetical protein